MGILPNFNEFIQKSLRVLRVSYRPTHDEFYETIKVTGLGMILIGFVGFVIAFIFNLLERKG
jgi:protein transport protein SEC61 subunit gamma-like protein